MTLSGQQDYSGISPKLLDPRHQMDSPEEQKRVKPAFSPLNHYILAIQKVLLEEASNSIQIKKVSGATQVKRKDKVPGLKSAFDSSFDALRKATSTYAKMDFSDETEDKFYDEIQRAKFLAQWKAKKTAQAEVILNELHNLERKWKVAQNTRPAQEFKRMREAIKTSTNEINLISEFNPANKYRALKK